MNDPGITLVYGAGGAQGGAIARALLREGLRVRTLFRDEHKANPFRLEGAETAIGSYDDFDSLVRASEGADNVVFQLPLEYDPDKAVRYGANVVAAAKAAGVKRFLLNTSSIVPDVPLAAFQVKRRLIETLADSGIPHLVIKPTVYMENLLGPWTAPGIVQNGVFAYPIPANMPVSWVSLRDVADLVAASIRRGETNGAHIDLGGPAALTGPDVAALLSERLGKAVAYFPIPHDEFERSLAPAVGADAAKAIADVYRWQSEQPSSPLVPNRLDAARNLLPAGLTPFARFIADAPWEAYAPSGHNDPDAGKESNAAV